MKNLASSAVALIVCGLGAFTIAAAPHAMPDHDGLTKCMQLHPERYCRIANGLPTKPLP